MGAPLRHCSQVPSDAGANTTWSPGLILVTQCPTRSTTPAPSCPKTEGNGEPSKPSRLARSVWQIPTATIRTRTSSSAGSGKSICSISNGDFAERTTAARHFTFGLPQRESGDGRQAADRHGHPPYPHLLFPVPRIRRVTEVQVDPRVVVEDAAGVRVGAEAPLAVVLAHPRVADAAERQVGD